MAEFTVDISTCLSNSLYEYVKNKVHHHGFNDLSTTINEGSVIIMQISIDISKSL
jgi:hypothetical protein